MENADEMIMQCASCVKHATTKYGAIDKKMEKRERLTA
jgi:hypothetical protein